MDQLGADADTLTAALGIGRVRSLPNDLFDGGWQSSKRFVGDVALAPRPVSEREGMPSRQPASLLRLLRCAGCWASGLTDEGSALSCTSCSRRFPVQAGVPVMITEVVAERGALLAPGVARLLAERFCSPSDPLGLLRVRRASGARVRARSGACLPEDGHVLAGLVPPPDLPAGAGDPRCEWLGEYIPRAMLPGCDVLANVRFRNAGAVAMASAGGGRMTLASQWHDAAGNPVRDADLRTPLPADLGPGQVLTLPLRLQTPGQPGHYTLSLTMVQEGVRWLEPGYGPFSVELHPGAAFVPPAGWVLDGPGPHDRAGDRARGQGLLRDWIATLGHERPRVLGLGIEAGRMIAGRSYDGLSVGGDLLAQQLGRLVPGAAPAICADLDDLPLAEGAFDAVICAGALHYLPDPARTLRNLRTHLRPGGFIAVLCEPVGQMWPGAATQAFCTELRHGRNPQGFSLAEYAHIFRMARLHVAELIMDGASLKARLEPEGCDA